MLCHSWRRKQTTNKALHGNCRVRIRWKMVGGRFSMGLKEYFSSDVLSSIDQMWVDSISHAHDTLHSSRWLACNYGCLWGWKNTFLLMYCHSLITLVASNKKSHTPDTMHGCKSAQLLPFSFHPPHSQGLNMLVHVLGWLRKVSAPCNPTTANQTVVAA